MRFQFLFVAAFACILGFSASFVHAESTNEELKCPSGYIYIPNDPELETVPFCVARFEMKNEGGRPISRGSGKPWNEVSRNEAIKLCAEIGPGYSLLTNYQWQAIARNIERVPTNWSKGQVGKGVVNAGNFSKEMGGVVESNPCATEEFPVRFENCTNPESAEFPRKRSHLLSTGEIIWDIGGNVTEWVSTNTSESVPNYFRGPPCGTKGNVRRNFGPSGSYEHLCAESNSKEYFTDGLGCIEGEGGPVIFRGGGAGMENSAWYLCPGIFYANTNSYWNAMMRGSGFRCAFAE